MQSNFLILSEVALTAESIVTRGAKIGSIKDC